MAPSVGGVSSTSVCGVQTTSKLIHKLTPPKTGTLYVHSLALQTPTCDVPRDGGGVFLLCFGCCIFLDEVLRYVDETFFVFQTYLKMMDTKKG